MSILNAGDHNYNLDIASDIQIVVVVARLSMMVPVFSMFIPNMEATMNTIWISLAISKLYSCSPPPFDACCCFFVICYVYPQFGGDHKYNLHVTCYIRIVFVVTHRLSHKSLPFGSAKPYNKF